MHTYLRMTGSPFWAMVQKGVNGQCALSEGVALPGEGSWCVGVREQYRGATRAWRAREADGGREKRATGRAGFGRRRRGERRVGSAA